MTVNDRNWMKSHSESSKSIDQLILMNNIQ